MADPLDSVLQPQRLDDTHFSLAVPPGWAQGRSTFGGLVLGAMTRAMVACEPEVARRLRSISGELVGAVTPGACAIEVQVLRRGNAVSSYAATLRQGDGDEVLARASAVLGRDRAVDRTWGPTLDESPPPWSGLVPLPHGPSVPEFAQHFEFRLTGPLPFSGSPQAVASGWIRARNPPAQLDAGALAAMADAWWPSAFSIEPRPRPMATVAFTMQDLAGGRDLPGDVPLWHRARSLAADQGYFVELRELWTERGELVALNQQTFVWIK
jgi:hypothetical protein